LALYLGELLAKVFFKRLPQLPPLSGGEDVHNGSSDNRGTVEGGARDNTGLVAGIARNWFRATPEGIGAVFIVAAGGLLRIVALDDDIRCYPAVGEG
jgi:hypothetical protein